MAILPQPNWQDDLRDFKKLGKPRLFFGITAGNMDSSLAYTACVLTTLRGIAHVYCDRRYSCSPEGLQGLVEKECRINIFAGL